MFKRTRVRLAALNTLMLFIVLNIFGGVVYLYMHSRLYGQIDSQLLSLATHLEQRRYKDIVHPKVDEREADRRIVILIWNKSGQLLFQTPEEAFFPGDLNKLRPNSARQQFRTITIEGHKYRSLSFPATTTQTSGSSEPVAIIQLTQNIEPEANMLSNLVVIVLVGGLLGGVVSLLVGLFLANRALIPIRESWEKQQHFVADASHELRTPLAVIQAQIELLFRHPTSTIEQESSKLFAVLTEVKRMIKMVSQLLTLARSDSNAQELEWRYFELDKLIQETTEQFRQLACTKDIAVESCASAKIDFLGDKERMRQLLIILLDNALKYTSPGGHVKVLCEQNKHGSKLVVQDTGMGIPKEDLPLIFDRFYRGDKVRVRVGGGTGLGLSIAKWIVGCHHGTIWVESKVGKGTTFHMSFPTRKNKTAKLPA